MSPYPADPEWARGPMRVVLSTYPDATRAGDAVEGALARRLAACGSLVAVESRYWWKDRIAREREVLVLFKTVPKRVGALFRFLAETHPYEVPEIVELDVPRAAAGYLAYLAAELDRSSGPLSADAVTRPGAPRARAARGPARTRGRPRRPSRRTGSR